MRVLFASFIFATIVGCSSPDDAHPFDLSTKFDPSFTPAERVDITAGFAEWDAPLEYSLVVVRVTDELPHTESCPVRNATDDDFLGYTFTGSNVCIYVDDIAGYVAMTGLGLHETWTLVAAHEYGHALGLMHYTGEFASVMRAHTQEDAPTVEPIDVDNLREVESSQ